MELITLKKTTWVLGLRWMAPVRQRLGHMGHKALSELQDEEFNAAARRTTTQGIQYGLGTVEKWSNYPRQRPCALVCAVQTLFWGYSSCVPLILLWALPKSFGGFIFG